MTEPASYVDPLEEALARGMRHIAELTSLIAAAAEVAMRRAAVREPEGAAAPFPAVEQKNARLQASVHWAPAHDQRWLANADLLQTARVWSAAAAYAEVDPVAASAMTKCETRLRALHPFAMARYDRLRSESITPLAAMSDAAPLFRLAPSARPGEPARSRPMLEAEVQPGTDTNEDAAETRASGQPATAENQVGERGQQIAQRLAASHRAAGRGEIELEDLELLLEARTTLPADVIGQIVRAATWAASNPISDKQKAVRLAAESFPHPVSEVVTAAADSRNRSRHGSTLHRGGLNGDRAFRTPRSRS